MRNGYLYSCGGSLFYLRNAAQSALCVRESDPDAEICLLHDYMDSEMCDCDISMFDRVARLELPQELPPRFNGPMRHFLGKIQALIQSPFEATLFLDSDTRVLAPVSELFTLMNRFDIAVAPAVGSQKPRDEDDAIHEIPSSFPEPNTGVILLRKNERTMGLLERWKTVFKNDERGLYREHRKGGEQVSLRYLLWSLPEIRTHFLVSDGIPSIYNFRWKADQEFCFGKTIKIHHHGSAGRRDGLSMASPRRLTPSMAEAGAGVEDEFPSPSSYCDAIAVFDSVCAIKKGDFYFIQVGANDGSHADPIRWRIDEYRWRGIMVEPVKHLYERLVALHGRNPTLIIENLAIATTDGSQPFYHFPEACEQMPGFPRWGGGMGSLLGAFDSPGNRLLAQAGFEMTQVQVPCLTLDSLIQRHNVSSIDFLQIDAEGFDGEILRSINFSRCKPRFIQYEDRHIQRVFEQGLSRFSAADVVSHLESAGYRVFPVGNGFDRFCVLASAQRIQSHAAVV